jgi:hypothetical protein
MWPAYPKLRRIRIEIRDWRMRGNMRGLLELQRVEEIVIDSEWVYLRNMTGKGKVGFERKRTGSGVRLF